MYLVVRKTLYIYRFLTLGYVQRNLSALRFHSNPISQEDKAKPLSARKADQSILDHDRKRKIEIQCVELQDKLEDEG